MNEEQDTQRTVSEEELAEIVTRDSMIGAAKLEV